ncbi:MAG TPA: hypothetical protein VK091_06770 [Virgibacillus sp.]|nr:hypothetical protein [Virgibacillus sp.]
MTDADSSENNDNIANNQILKLVEDALEKAKLLDKLIIEERSEGYMLKPKKNSKVEKLKAFEDLAGSAIKAGEDVKNLVKMANREEYWRSKGIE